MTAFDFLEPWFSLETTRAQYAANELSREIGPKHALKGVKVTALAARQDRDDFLFVIDESGICVTVHLTFGQAVEGDPRWPNARFYDSLDQWRIERMIPDHEEFIA